MVITSGFGSYTHDYKRVQSVGLPLDYKVEPTVKGLQQSRDEILEYTLDLIRNNLRKDNKTLVQRD